MKRRVLLFSHLLLICCLFGAFPSSAAESEHASSSFIPKPQGPFKNEEKIAIVVSLKGKALVRKQDGTKKLVKIRDLLSVGDRIDTGLGAFMQIAFMDQSKISLHGSSDLTLKSYSYRPDGDVHYTGKIDNGLLTFMAGKIGKIAPQSFKLETATAVVGIRGTSAEISTSDGKLPGRPKKLELMKKGGHTVTMAPTTRPPGTSAPPVRLASSSGKGFTINERGAVNRVTFTQSPGKKYAVEENRRIDKAKRDRARKKAKEKKESEEESSSEQEEHEDEEQLTEEEEEHESEEQLADEEPEDSEGEEPLAEEEALEDEEPESDEQTLAETEDEAPEEETPVEHEETAMEEPPEEDAPFIDEEGQFDDKAAYDEPQDLEDSSFAAGEVPEFEDDLAADEFGLMDYDSSIEEPAASIDFSYESEAYAEVFSTNVLETYTFEDVIPDTDFEIYVPDTSEIIADVQEISEVVTEVIFNETVITQDATISDEESLFDYTGHFAKILSESGVFSSSGGDVFANRLTDTGILQITFESSSELFEQSLPSTSGTSYTQTISDEVSSGSEFFQRMYDNLNEFFIVDREIIQGTTGTEEFMFFGKESTTSEVPVSGVRMFSTDSHHLSTSISAGLFQDVRGSLLTKGADVFSLGFDSGAIVDFDQGKIIGVSFTHFDLSQFGHDETDSIPTDPSQTTTSSSSFNLPILFDDIEVPAFIYTGTLNPDGSISTVHLYNTLGYQPSTSTQVIGDNADTATDFNFQSLVLNNTLLNTFTGDGHIYGSDAQGFGVQGTDGSDGFFASAGFHETNETITIDTDATYTGFGHGINIKGTDTLTFDHISTDISLTTDFTNKSFSGSLTLKRIDSDHNHITNSLTIENSYGLNHDHLFSELGSSDSTFNIQQDASFIFALDPPQITLNNTSTSPQGVMWGIWNAVENDSNGSIYPGLHNFWVAGIKTPVQTTENYLLYKGASLHSGIDTHNTQGGSPVFTDFGFSYYLADLSSNNLSGITFLPTGSIIITKGQSSSIVNNETFSGWTTVLSKEGSNLTSGGMFSTSIDSNGSFSGSFAGTNGQSLFMEFQRQYIDAASPGTLEAQYGVSLAALAETYPSLPSSSFHGAMKGVSIDSNNGVSLLSGLSTHDLTVSSSGGNVSATVQVVDSPNSASFNLTTYSNDINTFINKEAFITNLQSSQSNNTGSFGSTFTSETLDIPNTWVSSLPGTDSFTYISWGIWGSKGASSMKRAFGFFGIGNNDYATLPNMSSVAVSTPTAHYSGAAIASVFDSTNTFGDLRLGSASLDVDFSNGNLTGSINLGTDISNISLSGSIGAESHHFSGSTSYNGVSTSDGFAGAFYGPNAEEASGAFQATDNVKKITGALGTAKQ